MKKYEKGQAEAYEEGSAIAPQSNLVTASGSLLSTAENTHAKMKSLQIRLFGAFPEAGKTSAANPLPNGLLDTVHTNLISTAGFIRDIEEIIDEIEKRV